MSWWNKVFAILRRIIQTMTTTMTDYFSDEIEFDDELPIWIKLHETFDSSLFISNEKYILLWLYQFCSKFEGKKKFLFYSENYWVHFKGRK